MNNKKRYQKIFVNDECVVDFTEQSVSIGSVISGNTFFDTNGMLQKGNNCNIIEDIMVLGYNSDLSLLEYPEGKLYLTDKVFKSHTTIGYLNANYSNILNKVSEFEIAPNTELNNGTTLLSSMSRTPISLCVHTNSKENLDKLVLNYDNTGSGCCQYRENDNYSHYPKTGLLQAVYVENLDYNLPEGFPYTLNRFANGCTFKTTNDGKYNYVRTSDNKIFLTSVNTNSFVQGETIQIPSVVEDCPVVHIGDFLFAPLKDYNLNIVTLPEQLETIGASPFVNINFESSMQLPETFKQFHTLPCGNTYNGTNYIKYILPESFEGIAVNSASSIYVECLAETSMDIAPNIQAYVVKSANGTPKIIIGDRKISYDDNTLIDVTLPEGVTQIFLRECFGLADAAKKLVLPSTLKYLNTGFSIWSSSYSWGMYSNIEEIIFTGEDLLEFEPGFCCGMSKLKNVVLPTKLKSLPDYTFSGCSSLTYLELPETLTVLGSCSLQIGSTTAKATIKLKSTLPPQIATDTFTKTNINKIIIPKGSYSAYAAATNWSALADKLEEAAE
jgi:hypothetical protein